MDNRVILITGSRKGIGRYLSEYYLKKNYIVIGCSRNSSDLEHVNYHHFCADVSDENQIKQLFRSINKEFGRLDILINNAGLASMNHSVLTPVKSVVNILNTNVMGTFLFCREGVKMMKKSQSGRIINFTSVAVPLKLEGEAIYASSKAAVNTLTCILAKEFANYGITVNAIGPTPVKTDLIRNVPESKINSIVQSQTVKRLAVPEDIINVIDFFIKPESSFITGQILYLGGI